MVRLALPPPFRGHELIVLGAGAGVLFVGAMALRGRTAIDAGGSDVDPSEGFDPSALGALLSQALSSGAAAAVAGFAPGAELGAAGLGMAGQAYDSAAALAGISVQSSASVAAQLADSQSFIGAAGIGLAQSLGQGLLGLLPVPLYPTLPPPPATPVPAPPPNGTILPVTMWGSDVPAAIRAVDPNGGRVAAAVTRAGWNYGSQVNIGDLQRALSKRGHNYGTVVDPSDVQWLLTH